MPASEQVAAPQHNSDGFTSGVTVSQKGPRKLSLCASVAVPPQTALDSVTGRNLF